MHRVVVVGGGFSGAMVGVHLARDHAEVGVSVTVVEPRAVVGTGLAYGTRDPACRVNVAASRMSPFEEELSHFDDWVVRNGVSAVDPAIEAAGGRFPGRAVYGAYVSELADGSALTHRRARAVAGARDASRFVVTLDDGGTVEADTLVVATGHPPPALPRGLRAIAEDGRLVRDPWEEPAIGRIAADADSAVLVVGTGLTSCDVLASLRARGHRGPVTMVSRHGLLPRARTALPVEAHGEFREAPAGTALELLVRVRAAVAEVARLGRPWEDVIAALREQAAVVWRALAVQEQRRLLRHVRPFWDAHRFQCAPQIASLVAVERESGGLVVRTASLVGAAGGADGVTVSVVERGGGPAVRLRADWVVNCTGPGHGGAFGGSAFLASLQAAGLARPDPLGLGIACDDESVAIGTDGSPVAGLFVAGPPARSAHGELMGLPQVSRQPRAIAASIASRACNAKAEGRYFLT